MFKKKLLLALAALMLALPALATEVNQASQAELERIKGIGPTLSDKILDERAKSEFKDWDDLMARVKGMGARSSRRLSDAGLTVNGGLW
ncbi:MAG TPA: helix-hairpin-helix domain-containing protein [Methylibium sp.]